MTDLRIATETAPECCDAWETWADGGGPTDRAATWLHQLAHNRAAFTEAWFAELTDLSLAEAIALCRRGAEAGWFNPVAFGGVAGRGPADRGRTWVGALTRARKVGAT